MKAEVGVNLVFGCGGDERIERGPNRLGTCRVHPRRRQCGCLTFDSEAEIDHVEDIVVGADGRGLNSERRWLRHREHE